MNDRIFEMNGWEVECESPLEIRKGESFASGEAAHIVYRDLATFRVGDVLRIVETFHQEEAIFYEGEIHVVVKNRDEFMETEWQPSIICHIDRDNFDKFMRVGDDVQT